MLCANAPDEFSTDSISFMNTVANVPVGAREVLRYPRPYSVDEYISQYIALLDARRFGILPVFQDLTANPVIGEHETAYAGWFLRINHWGGRRAADGSTHAAFMNMPFMPLVEVTGYKARLSELLGRLRAKNLFRTEPSLWL